jgi:transcriptional regulator with XRE-family HTH domain
MCQKEVASLINSDATTISKIEHGKLNPSLGFILKMADAMRVDPHRFFAPEPLVPKSIADREPRIIETFPDQETHEEFRRFGTADEYVPIRILADSASLGQGHLITSEEARGYALIYKHALSRKAWNQPRRAEKIVCLFAAGDSMTPTIQDGSLVAIDIEDTSEIQKGKIYAVEIPDEGVTIKRVYRAGDHLALFADNQATPGFPCCVPLNKSFNPVRGRVVWAWNVLG